MAVIFNLDLATDKLLLLRLLLDKMELTLFVHIMKNSLTGQSFVTSRRGFKDNTLKMVLFLPLLFLK